MEKGAKKHSDKAESELSKLLLKTPKGTRDYAPSQMAVRESVLDKIKEVFKNHGAVAIDTPVFELRDVLMGKYGEEGGKLVYDLADQGGEKCSLRYDLTVPFARYMAMNKNEPNLKRYQIGKVYRRDQPVMTKGRYREFYQCDFDIAGNYESMLPDAECLKVTDEVLSQLDIGSFEIKVNHRSLLEGVFAVSGIKDENFKAVCSSVDKLDKHPWAEVKQELINEKMIAEIAVNKLEKFMRLRENNPNASNVDLLGLVENCSIKEQENVEPRIAAAISDIKLLLEYANLLGASPDRVIFDPSLARGLDYYTGVIYEAVVKDSPLNSADVPATDEGIDPSTASYPIGSVAAGGRYDKLVGMFLKGNATTEDNTDGKKKKKAQNVDIPCVGVSFGIERLFTIMEFKATSSSSAQKVLPTDVYVVSPHSGMLRERMKLCSRLWAAGIRCELTYKTNPKILNDLQHCESKEIPLACIVAGGELERGCVKVKDVKTREETEVQIDGLVEMLQKKLGTK